MIQTRHLFQSCWAPEDLDVIQQILAQAYPEMAPALRNAIVLLSMDEVKPREGLAALQQRVDSFAHHCPVTSGLEQMLAS